jgi:hypothetical protein
MAALALPLDARGELLRFRIRDSGRGVAGCSRPGQHDFVGTMTLGVKWVTLEKHSNAGLRDAGLKMDWTKLLPIA